MRSRRIRVLLVGALASVAVPLVAAKSGPAPAAAAVPAASVRAASVPAASCPAGTTFVKHTYTVPVTQPDDYGKRVSIAADVYVPTAPVPAAGFPVLDIFHGGGSTKDNTYDSGHAAYFASNCFVVLLYSQRGNGTSGGQEAVAGPKEIRDLFDITAWLVGVCASRRAAPECREPGMPPPPHVSVDPGRIALTGYSQGGLNTNLGEVWRSDRTIDPYGISIAAIMPGNTPDYVLDALVPNGVVKLSFGVGLVETYATGPKQNVDPLLAKWVATAAADEPSLYGNARRPCDTSVHDTATSTMAQDLAWRSVGCFASAVTAPVMWAQSFDDGLFPPDMALDMFGSGVHGMPAIPTSTPKMLYLTMGGHAAPAAPQAAETDKVESQLQFLRHVLDLGSPSPPAPPPVVFWTRDPAVSVPSTSYRYPDGSWYRQVASTWPPHGVADVTYRLGADGRAASSGPVASGAEVLQPYSEDEARDPVAAAAASATPLGTSPFPDDVPPTDAPGFLAAFETTPFVPGVELDGSPAAVVSWTPFGPDSQLVLEVLDRAPDGRLTLLSRGVTGVRSATPGTAMRVAISGNAFSARILPGHQVVAWVTDGDVGFYKPYPDGTGGVLRLGPGATLSLPLRPLPARNP